MIATFLTRVAVLSVTLGAFALLVFLMRHEFRVVPVLVSVCFAIIWLIEGFGLRVLIQMMAPMIEGSGLTQFFIECLLWPLTVWWALGII